MFHLNAHIVHVALYKQKGDYSTTGYLIKPLMKPRNRKSHMRVLTPSLDLTQKGQIRGRTFLDFLK